MTLTGPLIFLIQLWTWAKYYTESWFYDAPWYNLINTTNYQWIHFLLVFICIVYPIYCGYKKPPYMVLLWLVIGIISVIILSVYLHLDWFGNCSDFCWFFTIFFFGPLWFIVSTILGGIVSRSTYTNNIDTTNQIMTGTNQELVENKVKDTENLKKINPSVLIYWAIIFTFIGAISLGFLQNAIGVLSISYLLITAIKKSNKRLLWIIIIGIITIIGIRFSLWNNPFLFQTIGNTVTINNPWTYTLDNEKGMSPRNIYIQIWNGNNPPIPANATEIDYTKKYTVKWIAEIDACSIERWCDIIIEGDNNEIYRARWEVIPWWEMKYYSIWSILWVWDFFRYTLLIVIFIAILWGTMIPKKEE